MSLNLMVYGDDDDSGHAVEDAVVLGWSSHYGEGGGGFGYLRFSVPRPVGYDYLDIGYGLRVMLYKTLGVLLFDGMIRQIEERTGEKGDEIMVTALGWPVVADDDEVLKHICDTRFGQWRPSLGEIPKRSYRPDKYSTGNNNSGLYIQCNNNTDYVAGDHTSLRYQFNDIGNSDPFDETAERIKCTLSSMMGAGAAFDGDVIYALFSANIDTVDDGTDTVVYKDDSNEDTVINGDTLRNITRDAEVTISTVTQATNTIVLGGAPDLSTWAPGDSLEILEGRFEYGNTNNHTFLQAGMTISNLTRGKEAAISAVDKVNYLITVTSRSAIVGWEIGDEIFMPGPIFWANVSSVSGADLVYQSDVGEDNLSSDWTIANTSKKAFATVSSVNTGTNTITVNDSADIEGWDEDDVIAQPVMLFFARMDGGAAGATITYKTEIGERLVKNDAGWVLYNEDRDEYATVASWNVASDQLDVDAAGDVASWVNNEVLRIYTPFKFYIQDGTGTIWPTSDWREGTVLSKDVSINVTSGNSTTYFELVLENYITGSANETTFVQLKDLKVYNTQSAVTPVHLAQYITTLLQSRGISGDQWDIDATIDNVVEPMVLEYMTPKEAMGWVCGFGDGQTPPAKIAWGIRLDDGRRFYLENQDLDEVSYYISRAAPAEIQLGGDISSSAQRVQGVYMDHRSEEQFTPWQIDPDYYFADRWRRVRVRLDNVDNETDAIVATTLFLDENKNPKRSASYRVSDGLVFSNSWLPIPFDEVKATGKLVKIEGPRLGTKSGPDLRDTWVTEQIVATEIDYQSQSVNIIPAGAKKSFEQYIAILARISEK